MQDKQCNEIRWLTPEKVLAPARAYFGGEILLDPATEPNNPTKARKFFTVEDDGLAQPWNAPTWINPPYGKQFSQWCEKIHSELQRLPALEVIALFPCGSGRPGTRYWQNHVLVPELKAICYLNKRLAFLTPAGEPMKQNNYPSSLLGFNVDVDRFVTCFGHLGKILKIEIANPELVATAKRAKASSSASYPCRSSARSRCTKSKHRGQAHPSRSPRPFWSEGP